jgi:hypothetical protein
MRGGEYLLEIGIGEGEHVYDLRPLGESDPDLLVGAQPEGLAAPCRDCQPPNAHYTLLTSRNSCRASLSGAKIVVKVGRLYRRAQLTSRLVLIRWPTVFALAFMRAADRFDGN